MRFILWSIALARSDISEGVDVGLSVGMVARCLNTPHVRGMGRYLLELLRQSRPADDLHWHLFGDDPRYPIMLPAGVSADVDVFAFRGDRFYLWEQIGLPVRAIKTAVDVLHCTETTLPLWQPRPTVVTVHDTLTWEDAYAGKVDNAYWNRLQPAALAKCAAVITISESSKNDILARWPGLEPKLAVIPHGIGEDYFHESTPALPEAMQREVGAAPYVVYLGGPMGRKRFSWALEVVARCSQPALKLIACGFSDAAAREAKEGLPREMCSRVHFPGFLSEDELIAVYRGAQAVLYPTLYEGFGFPAIEAQASGVPVLFSALGSLRELIGPLAVVVPADDMQAWVSALDHALSVGRESLREKALSAKEWAKGFSWEKSFERHLAVYRKACGK